MKYFLNLMKNFINRFFYFAQMFADAKQSKTQLIHSFDVYLKNLKTHMLLYSKSQRVTHFFIKLKSILQIVIINYQDMFIIKQRIIILTVRLKTNMKKKDVVETNDKRSKNVKNSRKKFHYKFDKRNDSNKKKIKNRKKNVNINSMIKNASEVTNDKKSNDVVCYNCDKFDHISFDCSKKISFDKKINVDFIQKKEKSSRKTLQSKKKKEN